MKSLFKSKRFLQHVFLICMALLVFTSQLGLQYFMERELSDWDLDLVFTSVIYLFMLWCLRLYRKRNPEQASKVENHLDSHGKQGRSK